MQQSIRVDPEVWKVAGKVLPRIRSRVCENAVIQMVEKELEDLWFEYENCIRTGDTSGAREHKAYLEQEGIPTVAEFSRIIEEAEGRTVRVVERTTYVRPGVWR